MRAITEKEWATYRQTMHQRDTEHRAYLSQRFASAKYVAELASNLLHKEFQAKQVILFGSLVNPTRCAMRFNLLQEASV